MLKNTFARSFFLNILLPTLLTMVLFVVAIFFIIIPASKQMLLDRKREMIRELTNSAWNLLESYHEQVQRGELGLDKAQSEAKANIRALRYGDENKDYFWITDMHPRMIVHPYRPDLEGQDLSEFGDSHGKRFFVEFVEVVQADSAGFVDYFWQWKDDSTRIVPKLSFVRGFEPWGWIVGTGIYIEDVRSEISRITGRLINISLAIFAILSLLLLFIARQTFAIERKKQSAEQDLAESREKYRTLVEASTEGTLMVLDNHIIFANDIIQNMLGFSEKEFSEKEIDDFISAATWENTGQNSFKELSESHDIPEHMDAVLMGKDNTRIHVLLSISRIELYGKTGFILIAKDMRALNKVKDELGESQQRIRLLTDTINIGVFRIKIDKKSHFTQLNQAAKEIFAIENEHWQDLTLSEFFRDQEEAKSFIDDLLHEGAVKKRILQLERLDGGHSVVSISAVVIKNKDQSAEFIDGIIDDISERKKSEKMREEIITELQTSLVYLNQPVKHFAHKCLTLHMNLSVIQAAKELKKHQCGAALVVTDSEESIGIVTADDLWERTLCDEKEITRPIYEIMTAPVISISENALVFEALLQMQELSVRYLPLTDPNGKITKIISDLEILQLSQYSAGLYVQEINRAASVDELIERSKALPQMAKYLIESGFLASNITRVISSAGDAVAKKLVRFALQELGEPPVRFAFMVFGSQGREEQTLVTDQDNAIIYENTDEDVQDYFLQLATRVNTWLDKAGYAFCKGDAMAKNPRWCVDYDRWKDHFSHWINYAEPQDLIDISIFFDFRCLYGDHDLVSDLAKYVQEMAKEKSAFFNHLAKNSLLVKPPITFTGNIKGSESHPKAFDIKHAILPIVDFGRIYALKHDVSERNTLNRLNKLLDKQVLTKVSYDELVECYNYLMMMRFQHQIQGLEKNRKPDNYINPKRLTQIEQHLLKKIFSQISNFQKKMSYDFTGVAQI